MEGGELEEKRRGANGEEMEEEIYTRGIFFFFFDRTRIRSNDSNKFNCE